MQFLVFLLFDVRPEANNQRGRETPFEDGMIWKCGDRPRPAIERGKSRSRIEFCFFGHFEVASFDFGVWLAPFSS